MSDDQFFKDLICKIQDPSHLLIEFAAQIGIKINCHSSEPVVIEQTTNPPSSKVSKYEAALMRSNQSAPASNTLVEEINKFTNCSSSLVGEEFWNSEKNNFKILYKIWCHVSSISPSNAAIERLFSKAKLIESDLRSLILPENLECYLLSRNELE